MLSSVADGPAASAIAAQVRTVLRPSGAVLWYDFFLKSPLSPHTRPTWRADIVRFLPEFRLDLRPVTSLPPLGGRLGPFAGRLCPGLARVPLLRDRHLGLLLLEGGRRAT